MSAYILLTNLHVGQLRATGQPDIVRWEGMMMEMCRTALSSSRLCKESLGKIQQHQKYSTIY